MSDFREEEKRYFLRKPLGNRKTFTLICYVATSHSTKAYIPIPDAIKASVKRINKDLKTKLIEQYQAEVLLNELILNLYKRANVQEMVIKNAILSDVNQRCFNKFWNDIYSVKYLEDESSAKYDFYRAFKMLEPLSIKTATKSEIQQKLKKAAKGISQVRRATDRLNEILKYLERDVRLEKPKEGIRKIRYVTKDELMKQILPKIHDLAVRDLALTLFCTGLRLSESMALEDGDYRNQQLNVDKQLTKEGKTKLPKREKTGKTVCFKFGEDAILRWIDVENKNEYRDKLFDTLKAVSKAAFPDNKNKWISPHDLRHSHAIHLLGQGATLTQVSLNLRNRIEVCQKYYTGFAHTDDTAEALKKLV